MEQVYGLGFDHNEWQERNRVLEEVNGAIADINRITSGEEYRARLEQEERDEKKGGLTGWMKGMFRRDRDGGEEEQG